VSLVVAVIYAGFVDRQLKTASHPGFLPENLPLYVYSSDLPLFWLQLSRTPLAENMVQEARPLLADLELAGRQLTGIRPTPARWRTWLGGTMAGGTDGQDWIVCTHPGLAAWAASLLFQGNVFPGTSIKQAWRDGYLILSSSPTLITKALAARPVSLDLPEGIQPETLFVQTHGPVEASVTLEPASELPMKASIARPDSPAPDAPASWDGPALAGNPIISMSVRDAKSAAQLAEVAGELPFPTLAGGIMGELISRWSLNRLPAFLSTSACLNTPFSCALYGLPTASGAPVPILAAATRATDAFSEVLSRAAPPGKSLPYEWNGFPGAMMPLLGEQFSLYSFRRGQRYYLATQEPLAAMLAAAPEERTEPTGDDVVFTVDCLKAAKAAGETVLWAANLELLPETAAKDLDAVFNPLMRVLAKSGTFRMSAHHSPGTVHIVCRFAAPAQREAHK